MKVTVLKKDLWYAGRSIKPGEELDVEETGEVRAWFALGWVKKAEQEVQTRAMTAETSAPIVENPPWEEAKSNIDPLTGKRRYRRRDMKAED